MTHYHNPLNSGADHVPPQQPINQVSDLIAGFQFLVPAGQIDFPDDPTKQSLLAAQWDLNLDGFTQQGMAGNPWSATNAAPISNYFNPKNTPVPQGTPTVPITWTVFPNRINFYCGDLGQENVYRLADTGHYNDGKESFPQITNPCTGDSVLFGPYGPRGWQDEYCEWSITYDGQQNITRIDFTCESPEYWNTLWMIDPQRVLELYQNTLNKPQIQLSDLYLHDASHNPVIDPSTGNPVYNPLNRWNSGTLSTAIQGGAMHLTSTPNTLQTDIGLASAATIGRTQGNADPDSLICCAQYGQPKRNSDPHIGQAVNQFVASGLTVSLSNPPGLFMQLPDFSQYTFPAGTTWEDYYKVIRGNVTLNDPYGNPLPGNFILHAVFEAPEGHTIQEVTINKNGQAVPITYAGQIAETINNQIVAYGMSASPSAQVGCVGTPSVSYANPLQLFHKSVFDALAGATVLNPVKKKMTLLSNSTLIAPIVSSGDTDIAMMLTSSGVTTNPLPAVTFDGDDITASVTFFAPVEYAVPGNSYPSESIVLFLSVSVSSNARTGLRGLYITNYDQKLSVVMPAALNVAAPNAQKI